MGSEINEVAGEVWSKDVEQWIEPVTTIRAEVMKTDQRITFTMHLIIEIHVSSENGSSFPVPQCLLEVVSVS